jgi:hypothetical protein
MSLATGPTAAARQLEAKEQAKDDARWDQLAEQRREEQAQKIERAEENLESLRTQGHVVGKPWETGVWASARIASTQDEIETARSRLLDLSYTNRDLRKIAKKKGVDFKIEVRGDGERILKWKDRRGQEQMAGRPSTFLRSVGIYKLEGGSGPKK